KLFRRFLHSETSTCVEQGVRVSVVGRRDRLAAPLRVAIEATEKATADGTALHLRVAVDYSARDAILRAAGRLAAGETSRDVFSFLLADVYHADAAPDVDLLVRTGGEQRLSDFMLWESAYAELVFTSRMWPDFDASDLRAAVDEFRSGDRRFGRVAELAAV